MGIKDNLETLRKEIGKAKLVVVSKGRSVDQLKECYSLGQRIFGENRVQEAVEKISELGDIAKQISWHMIGHLQRGKVKQAVEIFDVIQSVDTLKLAEKINNVASEAGKEQQIMLQVNVSEDDGKFGFGVGEVEENVRKVKEMKNLELIGLMAITSMENKREDFKAMKILFDKFDLQFLSMGMSDSYQVAITEGANMVRVGSLIFD
jgi:PLP dependent protein